MPLQGEGFVGWADAKRRAIYEAEAMADKMGIDLPKETRRAILERMIGRLENKGWDFNVEETVVRVDDAGVARVIPKSQAVGWISGLPAHRGTRDASSRHARPGRQTPHEAKVAFNAPTMPKPLDARETAQRFYGRIKGELERTGYIPASLRQQLVTEGWKIGQPVPTAKVEEWCNDFQAQFHRKYGG